MTEHSYPKRFRGRVWFGRLLALLSAGWVVYTIILLAIGHDFALLPGATVMAALCCIVIIVFERFRYLSARIQVDGRNLTYILGRRAIQMSLSEVVRAEVGSGLSRGAMLRRNPNSYVELSSAGAQFKLNPYLLLPALPESIVSEILFKAGARHNPAGGSSGPSTSSPS